MATVTINVSDEGELRDAIFEVSNDFATDGVVNNNYVINIGKDIDLGQSLPMIRGDGIHTITINGNGHDLEFDQKGRAFFVESGKVAINHVGIFDALAAGGSGGAGGVGSGGGGGGGLGAGGAVFVNSGAVVTLSDVTAENALAIGGEGGDGTADTGSGAGGGGGGGGLGGGGGSGDLHGGGGGGGGYQGIGGDGSNAGGGGGGEFGSGGSAGGGGFGGGGGGGQQGDGGAGAPSGDGGGEGGGATDPGNPGGAASGGTGGNPEGGDGGDNLSAGDPAEEPLGGGGGGGRGGGGGDGDASGGGGGTGASSSSGGGTGGLAGGGGGAQNANGGAGGDFGGGGGTGNTNAVSGGAGGFGGGGGGARGVFDDQTGGLGGFGAGGGGGQTGGLAGTFAGKGGTGEGADGGGGAALGGAFFVRDGGTLIVNDGGPYSGGVSSGGTRGHGGATAGTIAGAILFLHGAATTTFDVGPGKTVEMDGIDGTGSLTKTGDGTLHFDEESECGYTGATTVAAGLLRVDGSLVSPITVETNATLGGSGAVGIVQIDSGGALSPGDSPGILTTGNLDFGAAARFEIELGGATPGVGGYDQVKVEGSVDLGGAILDGTIIAGFVPSVGDRFTIVDNDGSDAVSGTFAGLAEGAAFVLDQRAMTITYQGGDGNDVVLTATTATIIGTDQADLVDATHTIAGQALPTDGGDLIKGKGGKDNLSGLDGDDTIKGGNGGDSLHGNAGNDSVLGQRGRDAIKGGDGDDVLKGGRGGDTLKGGAGQDMLNGGRGSNKLTGGDGDDTFVFAKLAKPDKVTDFATGDLIGLAKNAFSGIGPKGVLEDKYFHLGGHAETTDQHILYDAKSGWLLYAKHGSDTADPIAFARIGKHLDHLDHHDFLVV